MEPKAALYLKTFSGATHLDEHHSPLLLTGTGKQPLSIDALAMMKQQAGTSLNGRFVPALEDEATPRNTHSRDLIALHSKHISWKRRIEHALTITVQYRTGLPAE